MDNIDKNQNRRIITLAFIVITIATFAMIMQFKILFELGVANSTQVFVLSSTVVMQMAALLIIALQKTKVRLDEVRNLAYADELTGLINRRRFNEILEKVLKKSKTKKKKIGVLIFDLDRFKLINDCHGHDAGDKVICQFGERLQKIASDSSVICRMSGDEFAMMIKNIDSEDAVLDVCRAILKEMKHPFVYEGKKIHTSVSIGAAIADGFEDEELPALRMADYALLNSKESGRNQVMMFNSDMAAQIKRRRYLEAGLANVIASNALSLKYQPFVLQESSSITGVEALIRWKYPIEGEILPSEFILERACREIKPLKGIRLAININSAQFSHDGFENQLVVLLI